MRRLSLPDVPGSCSRFQPCVGLLGRTPANHQLPTPFPTLGFALIQDGQSHTVDYGALLARSNALYPEYIGAISTRGTGCCSLTVVNHCISCSIV